MSSLGPELQSAALLDLFAASGALGLEALSRGAESITFVERDRAVVRTLRGNIEALEAESQSEVVMGDVFAYVERLEPLAFDIALADPPYGVGVAARLIESFRRVPFARILSVEFAASEGLELPPGSRERRYGETTIAIIPATDVGGLG